MSKFMKLIYSISAIAPIGIVFSLILYFEDNIKGSIIVCCVSLLFALSGLYMFFYGKRNIQEDSITIDSVEIADKRILSYFISYILPLSYFVLSDTEINYFIFFIASVLLVIIFIWSHSGVILPILAVFGYHYYECDIKNGSKCLLIAKRKIRNTSSVKKVIRITEYMLIESED